MLRREPIAIAIENMKALKGELLNGHNEKAFQMDYWQSPDAAEWECGFAGCFLGWATHRGWYKGMTPEPYLASVNGDARVHWEFHGSTITSSAIGLATLFGIKPEQADWIILPTRYRDENNVTIDEVIERLEALHDGGVDALREIVTRDKGLE